MLIFFETAVGKKHECLTRFNEVHSVKITLYLVFFGPLYSAVWVQ